MKSALILCFLTLSAWAKPVVLISYYDAFGGSPYNNSQVVAHLLAKKLNSDSSSVEIKLCALSTVYDLAYAELENCLKELPVYPQMILGLGEGKCSLKIEMAMHNLDKSNGADNEGVERNNTPVIPGAEKSLGLTYPLPSMYCALDAKIRNELEVSTSAGSFVCNNTAFKLKYYYPEIPSGFIHVPANNCRNVARNNPETVETLGIMIQKGMLELDASKMTPLPFTKKDLQASRLANRNTNKCHYELFNRARGIDERGFWSFSNLK